MSNVSDARCGYSAPTGMQHIVIFHIGIHYVKLLLDGKECPMALGK